MGLNVTGTAEGLEVTGITVGVAVVGTGTVVGLGLTGRPVNGRGEGDIETSGLRVGGAIGALELCTVVDV